MIDFFPQSLWRDRLAFFLFSYYTYYIYFTREMQ
jgi:hypothetical protein